MNFDFSEEQTMLRDSVRRYVSDNYSFDARQKIVAEGGFSSQVWSDFAELGLLGLTAPSAVGGSEMSLQEAMVVMEELGRGLVLEPVAAMTIVTSRTLKEHASADSLHSAVVDGSNRVSLAYLEHQSRYNLEHCTTKATQAGEGWQITGKKGLVSAADTCDAFIVSAQTSKGLSLFLVPAKQATISVIAYNTQDGSRAGEVSFSAAAAELIGQEGHGLKLLKSGLNQLIACYCAESIGIMETLCDMTGDYLNTRKQFGTEIGKFQVLRHRLVDMRLELELARGMSWKAAITLSDTGASVDEQNAAVSAAKVVCGKAMRIVGQGAVQLHGGIAVTLEYSAGHYFKRLTALEMMAGDTNHHLGLLAQAA